MQFTYQSCTNYFVFSMKLQCYNPCSGTLKCTRIFTTLFFFLSFSFSFSLFPSKNTQWNGGKTLLITCESHTTFLVSCPMRGGLVCLTGPHLSDTLTLPIIPRYQSANIAHKSTYNRLPVATGCLASVSTMLSAICMPPSKAEHKSG